MRHSVRLLWIALAALLFSFAAACGSDEGAPPTTASTNIDASAPIVDGSAPVVDASTTTDSGLTDSGDTDSGIPPAAPTITSFTAAKALITSGTATTLTAIFANGTGTIDKGVGAATTNVAVSTGNLTATTLFTLTVTGAGGQTVTANLTVTVIDAPTITSFTADDDKLTTGSGAMLTGVFAGGTGSVDQGIGAVTTNVAASTGNLTANKTYTLTVTNSAGDSVTAQVTVQVFAAASITSFVAGASEVSRGGTTTVTGVFAGGTGSVNQGVGAVTSGNATATGTVNGDTTFTLTVTNEAGDAVTATADVKRKKELYVSSYASGSANAGSVAVFDYDANGNVAPKRRLAGVNTGFTGSRGLFVINDEVVVAQQNATVSFFNVTDTGDVAPKRKINGISTTFGEPVAPFIVGGEIFVGNEDAKLLVFDPTINGDQAPKRTLTGALTNLGVTHYPAVDNGELYVVNHVAAGTVTVYPVAAFGNTAPTRTITTNALPIACVVDGNELIVSHSNGIVTYDKMTGAVLRTISGATTQMDNVWTEQVVVYKDEIYAAGYLTQKVLVYARSANGNVAPTRVISGANTLFAQPIGLFVY